MVMRWDPWPGEDFGYVTVKTPSSMEALMSVGCKHTENRSGPKGSRGEKLFVVYLGAIGQLDDSLEPPDFALLNGVSPLVLLGRVGGLASDGEVPALNVDVNAVLGEARQLERRNHVVLVLGFAQIHPAPQ